MVELRVITAKEKRERNERYRQEQIKEAQDRAKQLFEEDRARREAVERQRAEQRAEADRRAKEQADYYRKLKKQQDDFKRQQEFRRKQKLIAEQRKKYLAELEAQRQRLLTKEYMGDGLTPEELRNIKNMSPEELREAIKTLREELYTTTQKPISSMVLRSRYEDLKANEERDGDPMRRNPQSVVGKTFEEWRADNYPSLTELRERYDNTDKSIPFNEYVKNQGDYYVLNKQSVEVSPSGDTTPTETSHNHPEQSGADQTAIGENQEESKENKHDDLENSKRNQQQEDLNNKKAYEPQFIYTQKTTTGIYDETSLDDLSFIKGDKILELFNASMECYEDIPATSNRYYIEDMDFNARVSLELKEDDIGKYIVLAFRGTQPAKGRTEGDIFREVLGYYLGANVINDLTAEPVLLSKYFSFIDTKDDLLVHLGFVEHLYSIYEDIRVSLSAYDNYFLDTTGHSLGGITQSLFSYVYTLDNRDMGYKPMIRHNVNIGSPRGIYEEKFRGVEHDPNKFDDIVNQIRLFSQIDPVPKLPFRTKKDVMNSLEFFMDFTTKGGVVRNIDKVIIDNINSRLKSFQSFLSDKQQVEVKDYGIFSNPLAEGTDYEFSGWKHIGIALFWDDQVGWVMGNKGEDIYNELDDKSTNYFNELYQLGLDQLGMGSEYILAKEMIKGAYLHMNEGLDRNSINEIPPLLGLPFHAVKSYEKLLNDNTLETEFHTTENHKLNIKNTLYDFVEHKTYKDSKGKLFKLKIDSLGRKYLEEHKDTRILGYMLIDDISKYNNSLIVF